MQITLQHKITDVEQTILKCLQVTEKIRTDADIWQDIQGTVDHIRAEYFSKLAEESLDLIKLLKSQNLYINMTDTDYNNLVGEAENKLFVIPFGSADWQRQYGFIEGLKRVKFYTKTTDAIQD